MQSYDKAPPNQFEYEILTGERLLFFAWDALAYFAKDSIALTTRKGK